MKKVDPEANSQMKSMERPTTPADPDRKWDEFWDELPTATPTKDDDAWQKAIEISEQQNPNEVIEGQRFQGQGQ